MNQSMKKQVIRRNIRFWGGNTEKMFAMLMGFILLYSVLFSIGGGIGSMLDTAYRYLILCGILFAYIAPISYGSVYIPMVLSFGARRRETVWGLQMMNLLYAIQALAVTLICQAVASGAANINWPIFIILIEGYFIAVGLGQISAAMNLRFGGKGVVASVIVTISVVIAVLVFGFFSIQDWGSAIFHALDENILMAAYVILGAIGIVAYISSLLVMLHIIRSYEVKR